MGSENTSENLQWVLLLWRGRYVAEPRHAVLKIAGVGVWELNQIIYG